MPEIAKGNEPSTPGPPVRPRRTWLVRIVRPLVLGYLALMVIVACMQTRLIFPGASMRGTPESHVDAPRGCDLVPLRTRDSDQVYVLFGKALTPQGQPRPDAPSRPTLIYFYGNGTMLAYSLDEFAQFRRLGANVAVAEFAGYGMSSGKPSEKSFYATADAVYDYVIARKDIDPKQLIATGWSIGGGVAIDLAHRRPVAGVATFSAFTSMTAMARHVLPIFPVSLFLKHKFDNQAKIGDLTVPIFLAHGTHDEIIPFWMNARLAAAAKAPVTVVPVEGASHNDIFDVGGSELMEKFGEFVDAIHDGQRKNASIKPLFRP
jgi:hypothetical protein